MGQIPQDGNFGQIVAYVGILIHQGHISKVGAKVQ